MGLITGFLGYLGLPGIGAWPLFILSLLAFEYVALTATRRHVWALFASGWGLGLYLPAYLGTSTWGWHVLATVVAMRMAAFEVPRLVWHRAVARRVSSLAIAAAATGGFWALWISVCDAVLQYPVADTALALVGVGPVSGSMRIVGPGVFAGVIAAASTVSARLLEQRRYRLLGLPYGAAAGSLGLLALIAQSAAPPATGEVRVGVAQAYVDAGYSAGRVVEPALRDAMARRTAWLLAELESSELLVTTEAFDNLFHLSIPPLKEGWRRYARDRGKAVLLGSYLPERTGRKSNVVVGIAPTGEIVGVQKKRLLAPFGESNLAAGPSWQVLDVKPGIRAGALICLESITRAAVRPLVERGANLLVAPTSDVSFQSTPVPFMHLGGSRVAALVSGREMVWASNGGPSGRIDRWGRFHPVTPFQIAAPGRFTAATFDDPPLYWKLEPFLLTLCALLVAGGLWRRARCEQGDEPAPMPTAFGTRSLSRKGLAPHAATSLGVLVLIAISPAFIQFAHGDRKGSAAAIESLYGGMPVGLGHANSIEREFGAVDGDTGASAIALWLAHYGWYRSPATLRGLVPDGSSTWDPIETALRARLGVLTTRIPMRPNTPILPVLIRLRSGEVGVAYDYDAKGRPTVFIPSKGTLTPMNTEALWEQLADPQGLLLLAEESSPSSRATP